MIVARSQALVARLDELRRRENTQSEARKIETTLQSLRTLLGPVQSLALSYRVVYARLPAGERQQLVRRWELLHRQLQLSRAGFPRERNQAQSISSIRGDLRQLEGSIRESWTRYVEKELSSNTELLRIVSSIPDSQGQVSELQRRIAAMQHFQQRVPDSQARLDEFDQGLKQVRDESTRLGSLFGPAVLEFLQKVLQGQATIEDLSDEVLAWCRQHGWMRSFRIQLQRRG